MRKYTLHTTSPTHEFAVPYDTELNEEQLQVVMVGNGPILVIAGAGSGKTRTVTYRVARLIESAVDPSRILLVTFTNKAAREMLHRVGLLINLNVRRLWGGTFHHIANIILRRDGTRLGYERNFSILDRGDCKELLNACMGDLGLKTKEKRFPKEEVLEDIFSLSGNTGQELEEVILNRYPFFHDLTGDIERIHRHYQDRKKKLNLMDFDDLLLNWLTLLTDYPDLKDYYAQKFRHILVDEYQDTNKIQADIIDLLASPGGNVMVVGDDSQSIYSFRGANFSNIIDFPKRYENTKIFTLETNYRSIPEILHLANLSIVHNERQFPKKLRPIRKSSGVQPVLVPVDDVLQQASFVAQRMLEFRDEGIRLEDMAVLYRSHYHSMELQMELTHRNIPFEVRSGLRFFEQAHIKDVSSHLKIAVNPSDELAWKRAVKLLPKIGNATAQKIWNYVASAPGLEAKVLTGAAQILPKQARDPWARFVGTLKRLSEPSLLEHPAEMIRMVMQEGYEEFLKGKYPNYESRLEDINQLSNYAQQFTSAEEFLSDLALLSNVVAEDVVGGGYEDERVTLTTIHQAKGLEWAVVFIVWLAEGRFPSMRSLTSQEDEEEERRLFYVAATRAKDELYLCYPLWSFDRRSPSTLLKPSRFVQEIPEEAYEKWAVEEGQWIE
jgi:DNA helicase-2/ATP-dependent DNA helicase PcrA